MKDRRGVKKDSAILAILLLAFGALHIYYVVFKLDFSFKNKESVVEIKKEAIDIDLVRESFGEFVKVKDGTKICKRDGHKYYECVSIHGNIEFHLDKDYTIDSEYYKVLDSDYYIHYKDVEKIEGMSLVKGEYKYYSNYIPFNQNVILKDGAKLYVDDNSYFEVSSMESPIIILDDNRYGIEYLNRLVYVVKDDVERIVDHHNSDSEISEEIAVLNYHYTVSSSNENGELKECQQIICITDTQFDEEIKYLSDNHYYGASIRDLELFMDGKIRLPKRSLLITIDDGWYVQRSIWILEKYKINATLFLIGDLENPLAYKSDYLEIHSHTWSMHNIGDCSGYGGYGGGILCLPRDRILEDLRKSRESLDNTTYFCYPFYEYNKYAIDMLKEAGFTMAFAGGDRKVKPGDDKYTIPRYVIHNTTSLNRFISYIS